MPYQLGQFWVRRFRRQADMLCASLATRVVPPPAPDFTSRALRMLELIGWIAAHRFLFAYRLSTEEMKGNQLRLYLSALAYTLVEALRRLALKGTEWAEAQVDTIRLKLFKIGALVRISARRVWLEMNSFYPWKHVFAKAFDALRC